MLFDRLAMPMDELLIPNSESHSWYVTRTRSRCEKKLSEVLYSSKIHSYLPLFTKEKNTNGQVVKRDLPLFSGYMFVYVDYESRMVVEDSRLVASLFVVNQAQQFLSELKNIEMALRSSNAVTPITGLQVGQRVRVCKGPLVGIIGEIVNFKSGYKLILKASFIGQGIETEIDAESIEVLDC